MSEIDECFRPGETVGYRTLLNRRTLIESWGRYEGPRVPVGALDTGLLHVFEFKQVLYKEAIGQGTDSVRATAMLTCLGNWHALAYEVEVEGNRMQIEFKDGRFEALLPDGTRSSGSTGKSEFVLAGNMVPQLACFVRSRLARGQESYDGSFFSPEALQDVPYSIERTADGLRSNLGEKMTLNEQGWIIEILFEDVSLRVERSEEPFPDWSEDVKSVRPKLAYDPPPPSTVRIENVEVPRPTIIIGATLAHPPRPVETCCGVLFIGGSGSHDRHGFGRDLDLGYHELLDALAKSGVVSLRFDKRGCGSTLLGEDFMDAGFDDLVGDSQAVFDFLKTRPEVAGLPLFLIGHSQGGLVAIELVARGVGVTGAVLMATASSDFESILQYQIQNQCRDLDLPDESMHQRIDDMREFLAFARRPSEWKQEEVPARVWAQRRTRKWYRELLARDPLAFVAESKVPLLILQGGADVQVPPADAQRLFDRADPKLATLRVFPTLDHIFKQSQSGRGIRDYFEQRHLDEEVIETIRSWLLNQASGVDAKTG